MWYSSLEFVWEMFLFLFFVFVMNSFYKNYFEFFVFIKKIYRIFNLKNEYYMYKCELVVYKDKVWLINNWCI